MANRFIRAKLRKKMSNQDNMYKINEKDGYNPNSRIKYVLYFLPAMKS